MSILSDLFEKFSYLLCPTGTVIHVLGKTCPDGFLMINGQKVYQIDYPRLYPLLKEIETLESGTDEIGAYVVLPNMNKRFIEATTNPSEVGTLVEAGLPNITGGFTLDAVGIGRFSIADVQGAFTASDPYEIRFEAGASKGNQYTRAEFSAASSNAIYSGSSSVQPSSMLLIPCIKV